MEGESCRSAAGRMAVVGNYLPRKCGIGTFTTDLCEAIASAYGQDSCFAIAMNDTDEGYDYPPRVRFAVPQNEVAVYRHAGDFLNLSDVDVVSLQHEYGIYGGPAGSHVLALLRELQLPVVTTLHTILEQPTQNERQVLEEIARLSARVVTMSRRGYDFLRRIYGVPAAKIDFIPHGIPDVPFVDPNFYKDNFDVEGKMVLLTFGLLSANKGIEHVIQALPHVLERFPDFMYIVLGATHPHVLRHEGETYRLGLQQLARELGVADKVVFYNRFVSTQELVEFMGAADIYVTPYLNRAQITSGTLAYTVGAGKAVISTPYWYAEELLDEGRGLLVPFADPRAIAEKVIFLLEQEAERHAMRKRAYLLGREMIWPRVAEMYMESFVRARREAPAVRHPVFALSRLGKRPAELPFPRLDHLEAMTDDTGMLQHSVYDMPNYDEGYTTDDNARALIAMTMLDETQLLPRDDVQRLSNRYLAFLWHAYNPELGRFRNFMNFDRTWVAPQGSEDSHGRAVWSLGTVIGRSGNPRLRGVASRLFEGALPALLELQSPRAWAFSLLGIHEYLRRFAGDRAVEGTARTLASRLVDLYRRYSAPDWLWFEDIVAYSNARIPQALLVAGQWAGDQEMIDIGLQSLRWLAAIQRNEVGHFAPVGCDGWYVRGEEKARFDQQPVEAAGMVQAALEAFRITGEAAWQTEARRAFDWFMGSNDLNVSLYDASTGGCYDALHPDRVNQNEGAESTVSFLMALLDMRLSEEIVPVRERVVG